MKTGIELIAEERQEQIEKHGFQNDEDYNLEELKEAAIYTLTLDRDKYPASWEFWFHDKLKAKENRMAEMDFYRERLKIAGALIAAELDRINSEAQEV